MVRPVRRPHTPAAAPPIERPKDWRFTHRGWRIEDPVRRVPCDWCGRVYRVEQDTCPGCGAPRTGPYP